MIANKERNDECAEEGDKARKTLALLEGPIPGWWLVCLAGLPAVIVYGISYGGLGAALATATFCIILMMVTLVEGMRRAQLAIREAQRALDDWERAFGSELTKPV